MIKKFPINVIMYVREANTSPDVSEYLLSTLVQVMAYELLANMPGLELQVLQCWQLQ